MFLQSLSPFSHVHSSLSCLFLSLSPSVPLSLAPSPSPPPSSSPSHAVSTLVSCLPSRQPSLSATAFEKVLIACSDSLQMRKAYDIFTCMTVTHGLAPTRPGLQALGSLLCSPVLSSNRQWRKFRLAFTFHILEGQGNTCTHVKLLSSPGSSLCQGQGEPRDMEITL